MGLVENLEISFLRPFRYNVRDEVGNLANLSFSIKQKGLLQPILVRNLEAHYEIIAGHRRYEACKRLGWRKIICHIVELDNREVFEVSLIENLQRKSLNPIKKLKHIRNTLRNLAGEASQTWQEELVKVRVILTRRLDYWDCLQTFLIQSLILP